MRTAILVDGGFYRIKSKTIAGVKTPMERANELEHYCRQHLRIRDSYKMIDGKKNYDYADLYRIFYYDSQPIQRNIYHPLLMKTVDFSKMPNSQWVSSFLDELKKKRKFALRLGFFTEKEQASFVLNEDSTKKLFRKEIDLDDVCENDFYLSFRQKGVDMKIGIDIASLAYKKQVDQIVLIAGDSDFVPAAKLARREGIDFILDPMGQTVNKNLFEHIDGLRSCKL